MESSLTPQVITSANTGGNHPSGPDVDESTQTLKPQLSFDRTLRTVTLTSYGGPDREGEPGM